jgi:hypothetical protein
MPSSNEKGAVAIIYRKSPARKRRERQRMAAAIAVSVALYFVLRWLFTLG